MFLHRKRGLKSGAVISRPTTYIGRCKMGKFRFYHIEDKYIAYLHSVDNRVQYNKGQRRPYVGIVLSVAGQDYYVPLESPKKGHAKMKSSGPILKLDNGKLGIMGFNNMLPVLHSELIEIDFNRISDRKYRTLLQNQARCCNHMVTEIMHRAASTYRKATAKCNPFYEKICCDFKLLEDAAKKYTGK